MCAARRAAWSGASNFATTRGNRRRLGERRGAGLLSRRKSDGDGIHLLGPLAKKVVRIAPPLVITETQARDAMALMERVFHLLGNRSNLIPPRNSLALSLEETYRLSCAASLGG